MNELKSITQRMLFIAGGIGGVFALLLSIFSKLGFLGALFIGLIVAAAILFAMMMGLLDALVGKDAPSVASPVVDVPPSTAAPKAEAMPEPTPEPAPTPEPEPEIVATPEPAAELVPEPVEEPVVSVGKPAGLDAARAEGADDLKKIKGVGPKLELMLNSMGFYHFDQVAAWGEDEQKWVDENLPGFKGRATRDKWVEQAKTLAAG
jgi:predicted flap endonuclease-1-like 5' DNA nuclease